ncbi:hypothetical protein ILYODFUR_036998 [Ilyodon furcidens]|uniref:Uncharacterized protein n=1 Tax=Ilyodon furcidens TaxID=33524 RepID=A0ABV0T4Z8_9TELE
MCWCPTVCITKWKKIELKAEGDHIRAMIVNKKMFKENEKQLDSITKYTLESWFTVVRKYKIENEMELCSWLSFDTNLKPTITNSKSKEWSNRSDYVIQINKRGEIKSFQSLQREFNLENQDFYRYLQA